VVNPYLLSEFERKREHTIDELEPKETCAPQGMPRYPTFSRQVAGQARRATFEIVAHDFRVYSAEKTPRCSLMP
jgi:hypothetical protein